MATKEEEPKKVKYPCHDICNCTLRYCPVCDSFFKSITDKKDKEHERD